MDIKTLDRLAKNNRPIKKITLQERCYYVAMRGLYSQYKSGEIDLAQAEHDKEVVEDALYLCKSNKTSNKQVIHLNKEAVVNAVLLELGRYVSCGATYQERERAYPRQLFETRIIKMIDEAYGLKVSC